MQLIECVPNISEGQNKQIIDAIAQAVLTTSDIKLLHLDSGFDTNRTVITFIGKPESMLEAAFSLITKATSLIDMRKHMGKHPTLGSVDVLPFVPLMETNMSTCIALAKELGKKVGDELNIPVYLYEEAALTSQRRNLANIRKDGYKGLERRLQDDNFKPDFGPMNFSSISGATIIGARQILIAYNINLKTKSEEIANKIAWTIRESGHLHVAGRFKSCKAIGWYLDRYKCAQVSINLTNYKTTSLHDVFDECSRLAKELDTEVTGSEIIGLVPKEALLKAGKHYRTKLGLISSNKEEEIIQSAINSLDLSSFDPQKRIIEYLL